MQDINIFLKETIKEKTTQTYSEIDSSLIQYQKMENPKIGSLM